MDLIKIGVMGIRFFVAISCSTVIGNIVKFNTPVDINAVDKVLVKVGGYVLGGLVGKVAGDYAATETEKVVDELKKIPNIKAEEKPSE